MKAMSSTKSQLAIPFIAYSEKQGFYLNPEAQQFIRAIPQNKKIGVISIVGKYRTGKSFFVNRVLLNTRKSGFQVGPTINPCTKGLWMWKKTLPSSNPQHQNMENILIDTQGFGGMDENANHDSRIFLFSLLLSSYFIYNSVGSIDQNALNTLNLIINLAKDIESKKGNKNEQIASHFPAFLWVVRDFTLQIVDKNGSKINSKQYLENAVELLKGTSDSIQNKNKIRRAFKHFFQDRDCVTMVRPTQREKDLQRLDEVDNSQLRPEFITQVQSVRKKIFTRVKPKSINNKVLNGSMFVELVKGYLQAINKGSLPNIENAWVYVCRNQAIKSANESVRNLQRKLEEVIKDNVIDENELEKIKKKFLQQAISEFKTKSMGAQESNPDIFQNFIKKANVLVTDFIDRNKKNWLYKYKEASEKVVEEIKEKIFQEQYKTYNQFLEDFNRLKSDYEKQTGSGQQKWTYFNELSQSVHRLAGQIITTKISNTLQVEKQLLEQKINLKQEQFYQKKKEFDEERQLLRNRVQQLERAQARMSGIQSYSQQRMKQLKQQKEKIQQKYSELENNYQQKCFQVDRLNSQMSQYNAIQLEQAKSEINILKSNLQKQKTLNEMQKSYHEKEVENYKQKIAYLESENKKYKLNCNEIQQQIQNYRIKVQEKKQRQLEFNQQKQILQKKIQSLNLENHKKNQLMKEHNQWIVEKSYLENQISFLRNTVNQNKRLHDALVVALQQAVTSSQSDKQNQLVQTNKNLASALEKLEARCKILEQKQEKLKRFKKIVKNCTALQCLHCNKWIANTGFPQHLATCCENNIGKQIQRVNSAKENPNQIVDSTGLHITISQTLIKEVEENKPFTQYMIQISLQNKKWTVTRKFKNFCQLQQSLVHMFPSMKFPESSSAVINIHTDINQVINSKRTVAVEQRRKSLQLFIRDLAKIDQIRNSKPFRDFLRLDQNLQIQTTEQPSEKSELKLKTQESLQTGSSKKQLLYKALYNNTKQKARQLNIK